MSAFLSNNIKSLGCVLVFAALLGFPSTTVQAATYSPDDLSRDADNTFSAGGHLSSTGGIVNLQSPVNSTVELINKRIVFNNGTLSVDARFSKDADLVQSHIGVIFGRTSAHNFWSLQINPSGNFMVARCVDNKYDYVKPSGPTPALKKGTMVWNTLMVKNTDTVTTIFINGKQVFSGPHKFVADCNFGLMSQDPGSADFKNLKVVY